MKSMRNWMLAAAMAVGALGLGAGTAHAARIGIGVYVGGPVAYVPPCPGPGYQWTAGYWSGGYWVPGRWAYIGVAPVYRGGYVVHRDWHPDHFRDRAWHGRR